MRLWDIYHLEVPNFLTEAIQTAEMQRLKDIGMHCGCEYTGFPLFTDIDTYSRFDHSVGVALIVWHFTGDMAQALSGLFHDIATPAFAHVVDFLHGDHMTQESTEQGTAKVIRNSAAICRVLENYSLSLESVADYHCYPIADNDSPKLSADRLEYTLCNAINFGILTREQVKDIYLDLIVDRNEHGDAELMFRHSEMAHAFALAALKCSKIYASDPDRYAMQSLANLLKRAIECGVLSESDLYLQESIIVEKLQRSCLSSQWKQFRGYREIVRRDKADEADGWLCVFTKKRSIDPYIWNQGRVSRLFSDFDMQLNEFKEYSFDYWLSAK